MRNQNEESVIEICLGTPKECRHKETEVNKKKT
jgi:hypothetical protein